MKIIFIEDVPSWVDSLEFAISPLFQSKGVGLSISTFKDGGMVLQEIMASHIDYIFIDYDLGGSYGDEIISELNSSPDFKNIPIIFYSAGLSVTELKDKSKDYGNITCLTKNGVTDYLKNLI